MKLIDLMNVLSTGELNQLVVGNEGLGIRVPDYPKVIAQINLGLTALHSRFPLREKEVIVQQYDQIALYYLRPEFAATNKESTQPIRYIIDTEDFPFLNDVIRVERIYNEVGCQLPLNDDPMCCSLFTPSYDTVQVVNPSSENAMFITYRANHVPIPLGTVDATQVEVFIPAPHVKALCYYIAASMYGSLPGQENSAKGIEWSSRYEGECQMLENLDLDNASIATTNVKPEMRGWA